MRFPAQLTPFRFLLPAAFRILVLAALLLPIQGWMQSESASLAGTWKFQLDPQDTGLKEAWYLKELRNQIQLPGILQAQGYGNRISRETPWVLSLNDRFWYLREPYREYGRETPAMVPFLSQPPRHYLGAAWYQRTIEVPETWAGRRVELYLERTRWQSMAWIDGRKVGSVTSLVAPHRFELGSLAPGSHRITVRLDNRMQLPYRPDGHGVSDALGSTWNGIVGRIELRATPPVWIEEANVYPDPHNNQLLLRIQIGNSTGEKGQGFLTAASKRIAVSWPEAGGPAELMLPLDPQAGYWDEFTPELHDLSLRLESQWGLDEQSIRYGIRSLRSDGPRLYLNDRPVHLRGTHHGGDFPLTGHPSTDPDYWRDLFLVLRKWGLNHVRFHSFCPPEAAFQAADEIGFYLQPECAMWNTINPGSDIEAMMYAETDRMIRAYGNHPSFMLFSPSNEPGGRWKESLPRWVQYGREKDPRRLYTTGTGWPLVDEPGNTRQQVDFLAIHRFSRDRYMRGPGGWFGRDYSRSAEGTDVPVITHEIGQWCAYPDFSVIDKFTGFIEPGNFKIFRNSAAKKGLLEANQRFAKASGRFQALCYKEEIEANLRTPELAGFQLLDLHDYTGQGTALIGVLDPFWEEKSYISSEEWSEFCSPTVLLARLASRVYTTADKIRIPLEAAHYGMSPIEDAKVNWTLTSADGTTVLEGQFHHDRIGFGSAQKLGTIEFAAGGLHAPAAYALGVRLDGTSTRNHWNIWIYPAGDMSSPSPESVLTTSDWDEAEKALSEGAKVIFLPPPNLLDWWSPPLDATPLFWNRQMNPNWSRMLGLSVDSKHPALADFPTEDFCDWQWVELVRDARAIHIGDLPAELRPIVQAIDDWNRNWKLGLVFEVAVGSGKLIICSMDPETEFPNRPVARQLLSSLQQYAASEAFAPSVEVPAATLRNLWFDNLTMRRLGATIKAPGENPEFAIDGDPRTSWTVGRARYMRGEAPQFPGPPAHPASLEIQFAGPVEMTGLVFMPRQDDRNHLGDIREYLLESRSPGEPWKQLREGTLPSTFDPVTIRLEEPRTVEAIRLTALSGYGDDQTVALAEISILEANPILGRTGPTPARPARSTSTTVEVEEAPPAP